MTFEEDLINEVRLRPVVWNKHSKDYKCRYKSERAWEIIARNLNKTKNDAKSRWRHLRDVFSKEIKKVRHPRSGDPGSPNESDYSGKWAYYYHMLFLKDVSMPRLIKGNRVSQETGINGNETAEPSNNSRSEQNFQLPDEDSAALSNRTEVEPRSEEPRSEEPRSEETRLIEPKSPDDKLFSAQTRNAFTQSTIALSTEILDSESQTGDLTGSQIRPRTRKRRGNQSDLTEYQRRKIQIEEYKIKALIEKEKEVEDEDMLFLKSLAPYFKYLNAVQNLRLKSKMQSLIADEIALAMPSPSLFST